MVVQLLHISHVLNSQENTIVKESITVSTENYVKLLLERIKLLIKRGIKITTRAHLLVTPVRS